MPIVDNKRHAPRQAFDRNKILNGMLRACEKRPVALAKLEAATDAIEQIIQNIMESSGRMVEIMGEVEANMNHQQSKLEETGVKTAAVADGVENSLQHIGGIREKMDVLGQSGSAIRDVVEGLSAISEQNAASADSTMQAAHGMSDTMTELMNSSENLLALADKLEKVLDVFKV